MFLPSVWDIERGVPVAELPLLGCGISVAQCENVVAIGMGTPINYVSLWDIRTKNTRELGPRLVIFQISFLAKLNLTCLLWVQRYVCLPRTPFRWTSIGIYLYHTSCNSQSRRHTHGKLFPTSQIPHAFTI